MGRRDLPRHPSPAGFAANENSESDDATYVDKLDGKIPEDFWERKMNEWWTEEQQAKLAID